MQTPGQELKVGNFGVSDLIIIKDILLKLKK